MESSTRPLCGRSVSIAPIRGLPVFLFLGLLCLSTSVSSPAQTLVEQHALWKRTSITGAMGERWKWRQLNDIRTFFAPAWRRHMLIIQGDVSRQSNKNFTFGGGLAFVRFSLPHEPRASDSFSRREWRPYQWIEHRQNIGSKWVVGHRLLVEQRIFHDIAEGERVAGPGFSYRDTRFRVRNEFVYTGWKDWRVILSNEFMLQFGDVTSPFDQNRTRLACFRRINAHVELELGYLTWFQRIDTDRFFLRHSWICGVFVNLPNRQD